MAEKAAELSRVVDSMRTEMARLGLWEATAPPAEALMSIQPFSYDSLSFTQWLQWIFIPRITTVIQDGLPLPTSSAIHPMAEECLEGLPVDSNHLLELIAHIDNLIEGSG